MKKIFFTSSLSAALLAALSSCSTYEPDTSLTSKVHSWQAEKDDTQARLSLRNATHRAALDPDKAEQHENDLIFALQNSQDFESQIFFINELQLIGTDKAIDALSNFLLKPEQSSHAINALQTIHQAGYDTSDTLNEALENAQGTIRLGLIKALGSIRCEDSLEQLSKYIVSKDLELRLATIRSIANIADEDMSGPMLETIKREKSYNLSKVINWNFLFAQNLSEEDPEAAENHALQVLSGLDKNKQVHLYLSGLQTLYKIKGADFSYDLVNHMNDQNYRLAEGVARLLQNSQDPQVNKLIISAFDSSGEFFKQLALKVLIQRGDSKSSLLVAHSLKSELPGLRVTACRLSSEVKESMIISGLIELVENGSKADQTEASKALRRLPSDKSSATIRAAYKTASPEAQSRLMEILATKSEKQNADLALNETLSSDKKVSKVAFNTLKNITEFRQVPKIILMLKSSQSSTQMRGFQNALVTASFGKADQVAKMILEETSSGASNKANLTLIQVLSRVGGKVAFNGLTELFDKGSETVQKEVIRTLSKWQNVNEFPHLLRVASLIEGSNKTLLTRGLSSLVSNSHLTIDKKKEMLKKLLKNATEQEQKRIDDLIKKLK